MQTNRKTNIKSHCISEMSHIEPVYLQLEPGTYSAAAATDATSCQTGLQIVVERPDHAEPKASRLHTGKRLSCNNTGFEVEALQLTAREDLTDDFIHSRTPYTDKLCGRLACCETRRDATPVIPQELFLA